MCDLCKSWKSKAVTVLAMDNHWNGTWKQHLASIVAPFTIRKAFGLAFVPGGPQKAYALKLGFSEDEIETGFYAADTEKFKGYKEEIQKHKDVKRGKRFLFLGRYVRHKGIFDLWEAFTRFRAEHPTGNCGVLEQAINMNIVFRAMESNTLVLCSPINCCPF